MIGICLRHFIFDAGISIFFDNLKNNLFTDVKTPTTNIGKCVDIFDDTDSLIWYGVVTEERGRTISVYNEDENAIVDFDIFDGNVKVVWDMIDVSDDELSEWLEEKAKDGGN